MLSPEGVMMCRCDDAKMRWYLSRGLAKLIREDPPIFQLTFNPKGNGHSDNDIHENLSAYFLTEKYNRCCVCGGTDLLTRHHCVPYLYRRYLPYEMKSHNSHDVMMLCPRCHSKYEREADKLKMKIAVETGVPRNGASRMNPEELRIHKMGGLANTLIKHSEKIPPAQLVVLKEKLNDMAGRPVGPEEYGALVYRRHKKKRDESLSHGKRVMELVDPEEFVRRWRQHFIDVMEPKFLPAHWAVDNPVKLRP